MTAGRPIRRRRTLGTLPRRGTSLLRASELRARAAFLQPFSDVKSKRAEELSYWHLRRASEGNLENSWYERAFTEAFGLDRRFYEDKRLLDIGCGPRGSLEWADMAAERVGLDPLADSYEQLGTARHEMTYVAARSEAIPFEDGYFDVVSTFNSLDHVDDLDATIREIERVANHTILVVTDVNHAAKRTEPQTFSWDIVDRFSGSRAVYLRPYERDAAGIYGSVERAVAYDDADPRPRYGVLVARLERTR